MENFTTRLLGHVASQQLSKLIVAKDIVCTFASYQLVVNNREATKVVRIEI
jgi:hypothetical protein